MGHGGTEPQQRVSFLMLDPGEAVRAILQFDGYCGGLELVKAWDCVDCGLWGVITTNN